MKIYDLMDLKPNGKIEKFLDSGSQIEAISFKDATPGIILARQLTAVDPEIFEETFPEQAFINTGITIDETGGDALFIESKKRRTTGGFGDASDRGSNRGKIGTSSELSVIPVFSKEGHSEWTDTEVNRAEQAGENLVEVYISGHREKYLEMVDEIGLIGHKDHKGLLNYNGFVTESASAEISTLNPLEMYTEISDLITKQRTEVNNNPRQSANEVMLPIHVVNTLQATMMDTTAGTKTVLKALKDNFSDVKFLSSFRANDIDGASVTVAYNSGTKNMKMRIPKRLEFGGIYNPLNTWTFRTDSRFRIAGLDVLEDKSGRRLVGL